MRLILVCLLLASCVPTAAQTASLEERLSEKERRLEDLYAQYWRVEYKVALGDRSASSLPIQQKLREVVLDDEFVRELKAADFTDPLLQRRRKLFLEEAIHTKIFTTPELAKLVEEIERDEADFRYEVDGKKLRRSEVNNLIATSPDREVRRRAWESTARLSARTSERIKQAMKMRLELGSRYAGQYYPDFQLERKGVVDRRRLMAMFERIRVETQPEYDRLLARIRSELKIDKVEPWDISYFFTYWTRQGGGKSEETLFPRKKMWERSRRLTAALGLDLTKLPVEFRIAEITFGGGTYPILYRREVRILVNKYGGVRFIDTLLHEIGHALHYSYNADPTFILAGSYSEPFDEGLGQVMALMLYRPELATRYFGLTEAEALRLRERYRLKLLVDLRETMADSIFEFAAYENPDRNFVADYNRIYEQHLGVDLHGQPVWAFDPFYSGGPIYLQSYVLAEMVGWQVHAALQKRFGARWDASAGGFLREKFFSYGGRATLDQILEGGTGEALNPDHLIGALKDAPSAATPARSGSE
jgi:oligoendopeptidase F